MPHRIKKGIPDDSFRENAKDKWTRGEVARYFKVSLSTVRDWEVRGKIVSFKDKYGIHWYDQKQIKLLSPHKGESKREKEEEGRIQAQVFMLFKDGVDHAEIVIRLEVPIEKVRALYEQYNRQLDDSPGISEEEKLRLKSLRLSVQEKALNIRLKESKALEREHQKRMKAINGPDHGDPES